MDDRSYKYVMEQLTEISFGVKLTYDEIMEDEMVSYRFRQACKNYFLKEVAGDTSIESHFFYMDPDSSSAAVYRKLKTKVGILVPDREKRQEDGSLIYKARTLPIKDFLLLGTDQKKAMQIVIQEITISKMGLSGLVI